LQSATRSRDVLRNSRFLPPSVFSLFALPSGSLSELSCLGTDFPQSFSDLTSGTLQNSLTVPSSQNQARNVPTLATGSTVAIAVSGRELSLLPSHKTGSNTRGNLLFRVGRKAKDTISGVSSENPRCYDGLFVLGRFPHDPQSVLTAVRRLAPVGIELSLNVGLGISSLRVPGELCVASFTDSETWNVPGSLHDPQFALRHDCKSSALARAGVSPVDAKRHHYQLLSRAGKVSGNVYTQTK
jgi:hypothetical protein